MTIDALKEKWDGIYAWNVKEGKVEPPKHTFPKAVKDRADYFAEMFEDGMTLVGCLDCIFSNEKPDDYDWGADAGNGGYYYSVCSLVIKNVHYKVVEA